MGTERLVKLKYLIITAAFLIAVGLAHPAQAQGVIPAGLTVSGRLDASDRTLASDGTYYDDWFYDGRAGERITVTQTSTDFASWLSIGRVESGVFMYDKSTGRTSGDQARIVYDVPADGRYVIRVNLAASGSRTGAYTLRVDRGTTSTSSTATVSPAPPRPRMLSGSHFGQLDTSDPVRSDSSFYELWRYRARAGEQLTVTMMAGGFSSYMELGRMTGDTFTLLAGSTSTTVGGSPMATLNVLLPEAGEYGIRASSHGRHVGYYAIQLSASAGAATTTAPAGPAATSAPASSDQIGLNQSVTGSLSLTDRKLRDIYFDVWKFSGRAGQRIRITLEASDFTPFLMFGLSDGPGVTITSDQNVAEGGDAAIDIVIMVSGEYAIIVRPHPESVPFGRYRLTVRSR